MAPDNGDACSNLRLDFHGIPSRMVVFTMLDVRHPHRVVAQVQP